MKKSSSEKNPKKPENEHFWRSQKQGVKMAKKRVKKWTKNMNFIKIYKNVKKCKKTAKNGKIIKYEKVQKNDKIMKL